MKTKSKLSILFVLLSIFFYFPGGSSAAELTDSDGLIEDIPEPPGAKQELPSPIPMAYEFVGGLMAGEYDRCLANFDVSTFLSVMFGRPLKRLNEGEMQELYSYQVQVQRNEFRFLSKVMTRLAKDAKIKYSNPRFHKNVQCKINVTLGTTRGTFEFVIFARYFDERWVVYDYVLNGKRYSQTFAEGLGGMKVDQYVISLRPFYDEIRFRPFKNGPFGIALRFPDYFQIRENVSESLLGSCSALDGQFLLHIQGATYSRPQNLSQVAAEIKETIMPLKPKLYDQWKTDIAGVDIGNVLFQFQKNSKTLFTHMVIIPMGQKLVVMNFYHNSLGLLKNFTTIRDKILESLRLVKIEAVAGDLAAIPADDTSLPSGNQPTGGDQQPPQELQPYSDPGMTQPPTPPPPPDTGGDDDDQPPPPDATSTSPGGDDVPPPPPEDDDLGTLDETGDSGENPPANNQQGRNGQKPPKPPPPEDGSDSGDNEDQPPPPPPDDSGNNGTSGDSGGDQPPADYQSPDNGGGTDVSF